MRGEGRWLRRPRAPAARVGGGRGAGRAKRRRRVGQRVGRGAGKAEFSPCFSMGTATKFMVAAGIQNFQPAGRGAEGVADSVRGVFTQLCVQGTRWHACGQAGSRRARAFWAQPGPNSPSPHIHPPPHASITLPPTVDEAGQQVTPDLLGQLPGRPRERQVPSKHGQQHHGGEGHLVQDDLRAWCVYAIV